MSFSIERYKEESRKLDTTGVEWDKIRDYPLSKGDLFFLHYAMDVENHVPLYLSHLLVTRACMNPVITTFLSLWAYEELWHGENLSRFLVEYGIPLENDTRDPQPALRDGCLEQPLPPLHDAGLLGARRLRRSLPLDRCLQRAEHGDGLRRPGPQLPAPGAAGPPGADRRRTSGATSLSTTTPPRSG